MALPKCRCIYAIVNKENDKKYIGSTNNLRKRSYEHKSRLKSNNYKNPSLQKDYNKYGEKVFEFKILRKVKKGEQLKKIEKEIIENDKNNYNKRYISITPKNINLNGHKTQISVYIRIDQAEKLEKEKNKSKVVREALDLYFKNQKEENKMFFDNLFDYVRDSEIGNYKWSCSQPEGKEIVVQEIDVLEDPNLFLDRDREIEKNGNTYISINWGEDEGCYILESEIGQYAGRFWTVAFWKDDLTIQSYENIYRTKEDAMVAAKGNYEVTEDEILINKIN